MVVQAQNVKYVGITPPDAIIDNASATTAELDTLGFDYARIVCYLGTTDIALTALKVQESDTSGSGMADVTGLVYGTSNGIDGTASSLPAATDDDKFFVFEIDLRGRKRYLDVTCTVGDGTSGGYVTIWAELSRPGIGIETAAEAGAANILRV